MSPTDFNLYSPTMFSTMPITLCTVATSSPLDSAPKRRRYKLSCEKQTLKPANFETVFSPHRLEG
jgi:hypothetical protein